jgi:hypothetical protein
MPRLIRYTPNANRFSNSGYGSRWIQICIRMFCEQQAGTAGHGESNCFRRDTPGAKKMKSFSSDLLLRALLCLSASGAAVSHAVSSKEQGTWKEANHTKEPGWAGSHWA